MAIGDLFRFRRETYPLILSLFLISLGGLLLHVRIHSPGAEAGNFVPLVSGLLSVFVVPLLFNHPKTVVAAYVLTLASVAVGTIGMAYHSAEHWPANMPVNPWNLILKSTFPDIAILAAKVPLAHVLLRHFRPRRADAQA